MSNYWEKAIPFNQYLEDTKKKIEELAPLDDEQSKTYHHYYDLGLTRMNRVLKTYTRPVEQVEKLASKKFDGKILIISEGWCGDAAMIVPVIAEFFKDNNEVKIIYRDQNIDLINQYLTNGGMSIPIVLLLDKNNQVITHWGPRPVQGMELLKKYKQDPENYSADQFHNDLQVYYTKNKGQDIIDEILELL